MKIEKNYGALGKTLSVIDNDATSTRVSMELKVIHRSIHRYLIHCSFKNKSGKSENHISISEYETKHLTDAKTLIDSQIKDYDLMKSKSRN